MPNKKSKTKPTAKRSKRKEEAAPAVPDWLTETPQMYYTLDACADQTEQQIDLTMDEYDALKEHLAKLRGIEVPVPEAAHA